MILDVSLRSKSNTTTQTERRVLASSAHALMATHHMPDASIAEGFSTVWIDGDLQFEQHG